MKPYEQGLKNDDGGWGNAVASTSCDYIEFWIKDGIIYYNKFFIGINYDGSASNAIYAHHPSDFAGISLANNKQLDDQDFPISSLLLHRSFAKEVLIHRRRWFYSYYASIKRNCLLLWWCIKKGL